MESYSIVLNGTIFYIPEYMMESIDNYISKRIPTGDFLEAVISNDLTGAVARADTNNLPNLPAFVSYFYNEAPSECWGSSEKYQRWISQRVTENADGG